mmetsp:Transcript_20812/g.67005  ORF Transcript_20812/g.67005 Transcript_20812/m.67005 type:complete len:301 (+) Transcript_20812:1123-2025(+)
MGAGRGGRPVRPGPGGPAAGVVLRERDRRRRRRRRDAVSPRALRGVPGLAGDAPKPPRGGLPPGRRRRGLRCAHRGVHAVREPPEGGRPRRGRRRRGPRHDEKTRPRGHLGVLRGADSTQRDSLSPRRQARRRRRQRLLDDDHGRGPLAVCDRPLRRGRPAEPGPPPLRPGQGSPSAAALRRPRRRPVAERTRSPGPPDPLRQGLPRPRPRTHQGRPAPPRLCAAAKLAGRPRRAQRRRRKGPRRRPQTHARRRLQHPRQRRPADDTLLPHPPRRPPGPSRLLQQEGPGPLTADWITSAP